MDGVTQTATTLNFIQNNALLSGGVLNVSRLTHYDKIPLIYSTVSTIKDITQDSSSNLLWGTDILTTNSYLNSTLASYSTTSQMNTLLSGYTNTTILNTLLNAKQDTLTAGTNITISGNTISSISSGLNIQVGSVNQSVSTLIFGYHTSSLSNGILTIHGLTQYDRRH